MDAIFYIVFTSVLKLLSNFASLGLQFLINGGKLVVP